MGSPHIKSSFQGAEGIQEACDPFIPGDEPRSIWKDNTAARKSKELLRTATFLGCRVLGHDLLSIVVIIRGGDISGGGHPHGEVNKVPVDLRTCIVCCIVC